MSERLDFAIQIAKEAGKSTLDFFDNPELIVEQKQDGTPVTVADKGAERLLRDRIQTLFPHDAILGEEYPDQDGTSGYRWILDPIDGTKSFIHGVPLYSTLIGLEFQGVPHAGVIWIPALNEGVWAERGQGAWQQTPRLAQPIPAKVSSCSTLNDALFLTSEVIVFDQMGRADAYKELERQVRLTRTWGDAYGYYLVATGRADMMLDADLCPWDAGPLVPILEEAGGHFTDWNGTATIYGNEGLGVNNALFEQVVAITRNHPKKS